MIDFYYYTSPNARKVLIMLEETGLPYSVNWVDITAGEQFAPAYLAISPNNKVPAIVDHDGPEAKPVALFESGAILLYLAEKAGRLLPAGTRERYEVITWLFWQTSSQGPLLGQAAHFVSHARQRGIQADYATERYRDEAVRLYDVLESRLEGRDHVCGDYSIADIATFPWVRVAKGQGVDLDRYPNVARWCETMAARPSARKKLDRDGATMAAAATKYYDDETWRILFGSGGRRGIDLLKGTKVS
jgi:GST-like protein